MEIEFAYDLPSANPDHVQVIPERRIDLDLLLNRILQDCDFIIRRAVLQRDVCLCLGFV